MDGCPAYAAAGGFDLAEEYALTNKVFIPKRPAPLDQRWPRFLEANRYPPAKEYLARRNRLALVPLRVASWPPVEWISACFSHTYLVLCLGTIILWLTTFRSPGPRRWAGSSALILLWLFSYNFGTTFMLSIGHSMDVARYSAYQLAYTVLPQSFACWLLLEVSLNLRPRSAPSAGLDGEAPLC